MESGVCQRFFYCCRRKKTANDLRQLYICTYVQFFFHKTLVTKGLFILLLHVSSEANKIKNERHS